MDKRMQEVVMSDKFQLRYFRKDFKSLGLWGKIRFIFGDRYKPDFSFMWGWSENRPELGGRIVK